MMKLRPSLWHRLARWWDNLFAAGSWHNSLRRAGRDGGRRLTRARLTVEDLEPRWLMSTALGLRPIAINLDNTSASQAVVSVGITGPDAQGDLELQVSTTAAGMTAFHVDVDLNHDGAFGGPGESAYLAGTIDPATSSGVAAVHGLVSGGYQIQAGVTGPDGQEAASTVQSIVVPGPDPASSQPELPLSFEVNQGQADSQVLFQARAADYRLFIAQSETVLVLPSRSGDASAPPLVQRLKLIGANAGAAITGQDVLEGVSNYFIGNDPALWHADIPNYGQVLAADVYPGIDAVYHGDRGRLQYEFRVAPGADPDAITLEFSEADSLSINADGQLVVHMADGSELLNSPPVSYQQGAAGTEAVQSQWLLKGAKQAGFRIAGYDSTRELIIDPIVFSTYLGGNSFDWAWSAVADAAGNLYVGGSTQSTNFPTQGPFDATFGGFTDLFVTKINPTGTAIVYSTYLGGTARDGPLVTGPFGLTVDSLNQVVVTSDSSSADYPLQSAAQGTIVFFGDAVVTKLNAAGNGLVFSTFLGGGGFDAGDAVAVDAANDIYVTGHTTSNNFPTTAGVYDTTYGGGALIGDAFVTKYTAAGTVVYSTYLSGTGGAADDHGLGITVMGTDAVVTGMTASNNFPTTAGVLQSAYGGGSSDAFVTHLNSTGTALVYSTYLGGAAADQGNDIAGDAAGNHYVGVTTASAAFPTTAGAFQTTYGGGSQDGAIVKLNPAASALVYSTFLGGSGADQVLDLALDAATNVYVTGDTDSANYPLVNNFQTYGAPFTDAIVSELNPAGSALVFSSPLGSPGSIDTGRGVGLTGSNIWVAGNTSSGAASFPVVNPLIAPLFGFHAFAAQIGPGGGLPPPPPPPPPGGGCPGVGTEGQLCPPSNGGEGAGRVNVSRRAGSEWEGEIAIDPTNTNRLFTSSNTDVGASGMFAAFSTDGGVNWTTRNIANGADGLPTACCDPSVAWDNFGNLFLSYLNSAATQTVLVRSSDGGATFTLVQAFTSSDQPKVTIGNNSVWLVWNRAATGIEATGAPVTGLGVIGAFLPVQVVPTSAGGNFGGIAIGPTGQVMVSFQNSGSGVGPDTVRVALDPDGLGPAGFNAPTVATNTTVGGFRPIPAQPLRTIDADGRLFWDRSGGPFNGRVYLDYVDAPTVASNDTNIFVRFSDNNGATWSAPVQVNDDAGTNSQFWPRLAVDQTTGNVAVSWYDSRNSPGNTTAQFFAAVSTTGGVSFQPNTIVTAGFSNALTAPNSGNEYGDYTGLAFHGGRYFPAWADNSNSDGTNPGGVGGSFDWYTASFTVAGTAGVTVTQSGGNTTVTEGGATDTFTVVLNTVPTANVTITLNPGTQVTVAPATLTFTPANWNVAQTVTVTAVDDAAVEGPHTGTITFSAASADAAYNAIAIPSVTVNITDNDLPPAGVTIVQSGGTTTVAEGGPTDTYTVVLNTAPTANVTITLNPGTQVTVAPVTLTFTPANFNVAQTVTVTAVDDAVNEGPHTGTITHTAASTDAAYNGIAIASVTVFITDNDSLVAGVTIIQSGGSTDVVEGGATDSYAVVLNTVPTANVTITLNPGTQVTVAPPTLTFTPANWNVAQTVTVTAVDDTTNEGAHTGTITHTAASTDAAYNGIAIASVTVFITDNDGTGGGGGGGSEGTFPGSGGGSPGPEGSFGRSTGGTRGLEEDPGTGTSTAEEGGARVNVSRRAGSEWEGEIAIDPTNTNRLFTSSNTDVGASGMFAAFSTDGGVNWTTRNIANGADGLPTACCDPSVAWDNFGNLFLSYLNSAATQTVLVRSSDGGATFTLVQAFTSSDQPKVTIGNNSVWLVWNRAATGIEATGAPVTGLGVIGAFLPVQVVPTSAGGNFGGIAIGPTGQVMVSFQNSGSGVGPDTVRVALDPDGLGPAGFNAPTVATNTTVGGFRPIPAQPLRTIDADGRLFWDRSGGPFNGRVYLDYVDAPTVASNDTNIFVRFSDNNGATWSAPVQVNDDAGTNSQFWPRLAVDQTTGNVAVSWYDSRNSPGNTTAQFFAAVSTTGGVSFQPNTIVTAGFSNALTAPNSGNEYGDYTGLAFHGGRYFPAWADNSNSDGTNPGGVGGSFDWYTASFTVAGTAGVTVTQSGGNTTVTEGGATDTFTVVLNTVPTANVTITLNPGTQVTVAPATLTFTPANWNVAQTVTVTAVDDAAVEGPHTGTITFSAASADAAYNAIAIPSVTVNITDNDLPPAGVTIVQSGGTTTVAEGGPTDTYTVVLNTAPTANVTITLNPGTQVTVAPVTLTFTPANFNVAQTVTVTAVDDAVNEGPHTGTITHTAASTDAAYNGIAIASVTVFITDNDSLVAGVTIIQSGGSTDVVEGGATDSYAVVLNTVPTANVTITLNPGTQVTVAPPTLTFTPANWNVAQTVTVTAVDDTTNEGAHTGTITHTAASTDAAYNGIAIASVTVFITDNDGTGGGGGGGSEGTFPGSGGGSPGPEGSFGRSVQLEIPATATAGVNIAIPISTNLPNATSFAIMVDLDHDGSFLGADERNYAVGQFGASGAGTAQLEALASGSYGIQARAVDSSGAELLGAVQTLQVVPNVQPPSAPSDTNLTSNTVSEGAAGGALVGITASSTGAAGNGITYALSDDAGGRFTIDPASGGVSVADGSAIDFESSSGSYTITVQASDGTLTSSASLSIAVVNAAPAVPGDSDAADNSVPEGVAGGTAVGVMATAADPAGGTVTYSLSNSAGGRFAIDPATGVVTVAGAIDFESSGGSYTITAQASDGTLTSSASFVIAVVNAAPATPSDGAAAADRILENSANGTAVGVVATAADPAGGTVTYSLSDNADGRFAINSVTGAVAVANGSAIDFESSGGSYAITVQASDGTLASSASFVIAVVNAAPTTPSDSAAAANTVPENSASGTPVGVVAGAADPAGGTVTYSLSNSAAGRFAIDPATGVVTVAGAIDFESSGGSYTITVQASDGALTSTANFVIQVTNVNEGPAASAIPDVVVNEDSAAFVVPLGSFFTDPEGGLVYAVMSNANGLLVTQSVNNAAQTLTLSFAANAFGSANLVIRATDAGGLFVDAPLEITVQPMADTPSVTAATTLRDTQTTSGLVASRNPADGAEVGFYKITGITNGTLFRSDGVTVVPNGSFISAAQASAGLRFTPAAGLGSPGATFSFLMQAAVSNSDAGLGGLPVTANITVTGRWVTLADAVPTFNWSSVPGATRYDIWVSDLTLSQTALHNPSATALTWTGTPLAPGHNYRWWVGSVMANGQTTWSSPEDFSIAALAVPTPLGPSGALSGQTAVFTWTGTAAAAYDVWVDDLTTKSQALRNPSALGNSWSPSTSLTPGHAYRWWVRGLNSSGGGSAYSSPMDFSVPALGAPAGLAPGGAGASETPTFSWNAVSGAARYDVWVDNTTTGQSQVLRNTSVSTTSWAPGSLLTPGQGYRWWVGAVSANGAATTWSSAQTFSIAAMTAPVVSGPKGVIATDLPTFAWNAVTGAARYDVWVDNLSTGQSQLLRNTGVLGTSWPASAALSPGNSYRWWVGAVSANGATTLWSTAQTFSIPALSVPLTSGPSGTIATTLPTFRWSPVSLAARYDIWVDNVTTGQSQALRKTDATGSQWTPASALAKGRYRWWIRSASANGTASAWSAAIEFVIV